jgi:hypothetical protein
MTQFLSGGGKIAPVVPAPIRRRRNRERQETANQCSCSSNAFDFFHEFPLSTSLDDRGGERFLEHINLASSAQGNSLKITHM